MRKVAVWCLLGGLLLAGCQTVSLSPPVDRKTPLPHGLYATRTAAGTVAPTAEAALPSAAQAARADLAELLGVAPEQVAVLRAEASQWPDSCLGLGGPAESCLQQAVDGYQVELQAIGALFTYRTDAEGKDVRMDYPTVADALAPAQVAQVVLAGQLGLSDPALVQLVQVLPLVWLDACLGVSSTGAACAEVLTPGFRILLEAQGSQFEFHSNEDGSQIVQLESAAP